MEKFLIGLCFILGFIWSIIAVFVGFQTIDEKRTVKDDSWKFFLVIFIFFAVTALAFIGLGIHISMK